MKAAFALLVLLMASSAVAQQSTLASLPQSQSAAFRAALKEELSSYKNGEFLWNRCDIFRRIVERRIAGRLGTAPDLSSGVVPEGTSAMDISGTPSTEDETSIAISRTNPKLIVAGTNDDQMFRLGMPAYTSTDGGASWNTVRLPMALGNGVQSGGDPMIIPDTMGGFFYAFLIYDSLAEQQHFPSVTDIMVAHTGDGVTWTLGSRVVGDTAPTMGFEDKETIAVDKDPRSPFFGRLYVEWNHYDSISDVLPQFAWSDNGGTSWSSPIIPDPSAYYFPLLRIGKDGVVFLAESDIGGMTHAMLVSHDGGLTFSRYDFANYVDFPSSLDWTNSLKGMRGVRAFPYVAFDVDSRNNSLYGVYGTWDDIDSCAVLYYIESHDEGATWTTPQSIATPGNQQRDHFFPWVSFDTSRNRAFASFYSSEEDAQNVRSRFSRVALPAVDTFQAVGADLFDPRSCLTAAGFHFMGDYAGSDAFDGTYAAAWTENRPGHSDPDVFAYVESPQGARSVEQISPSELSMDGPFPNPVMGNTAQISVSANPVGIVFIRLVDLTGREVWREVLKRNGSKNVAVLDLSRLPAGVYHTIVSDDNQSLERTLVVLR